MCAAQATTLQCCKDAAMFVVERPENAALDKRGSLTAQHREPETANAWLRDDTPHLTKKRMGSY